MAQNMPSGPTRLGPEGYVAPTPRPSLVSPPSLLPQLTHRNAATDSAFNATENTPAAHTLTGSMIS